MKEDWIDVELGEVCDYSKGKKPKLLMQNRSGSTPYPYINIKAFEKGIFEQYTDGEKCNLCEEGDLLMVWDGARAGFTGKAKKGAIGSTLMKIEPLFGIEQNYIFYFLLSLYKKLNTNPRGVGIPHVEPNILWNAILKLPNNVVQRAIVTKIENMFTSLDKGIEDLKKAQEQLKIYRQSVLKKAFEGELTKEWREKQTNLPTAEELLEQIKVERKKYYEKHLSDWKIAVKEWEENGKEGKKPSKPKQLLNFNIHTEVFETLPNITHEWSWCCLGNVFKESPQNGLYKPSSAYGNGTKIVRIDNFYDGKLYDPNTFKMLEISDAEIKKYMIVHDDLLINRVNSIEYLGKCCLVKGINENVVFESNIMRITFLSNIVSSKFINLYLVGTVGNQQIKRFAKHAVNQASINQTDVSLTPFPICSLQEQQQIVKEIESRLSVCDQVEKTIEESLEKAEALRQSILKKAFEGELLTDSEIAECKKAPDYEPASVLLERIKKEKKK